MRPITLAAAAATALLATGCASTGGDYGGGGWRSACERDYERNRNLATAAGALAGAAAGAAIDRKDTRGAIIGAVVGGIVGRVAATKDDPCGYGFGGYPYRPEYGYWDERTQSWRR
ncbi:MAG: glycine zipper 2TM domain-containing protein [Pseudomonadota bacterium]